jgi:ferredoxin-thioredoxin reductase catalytic subunit
MSQVYDPAQLAAERSKIESFVQTVCQKFDWELYEQAEVSELVREGLAKNRIEYGFQACPCYSFLSYHKRDAQGELLRDAKGQPQKNLKVNCPCEPARELDVPGTKQYASMAEMEQKTAFWPDRGTITENTDGTVTLTSYHPGFCHCFLFKRPGATL